MTFVSKIWGTDGNCVQNGHDISDMHIVQVTCFERFAGEPATCERVWRRDRDSNPGYLAVYTLSKRAPSATRPSLRGIAASSNLTQLAPAQSSLEARPKPPALTTTPYGACAVMFCFTIADDFNSTGTPCIR